MSKNKHLGLDELMIVNPGPEGGEGLSAEDESLQQIQGLNEDESLSKVQFFLGEDGNLYQVEGLGEEPGEQGLNEYFLGDDGVLYRIAGPDESTASPPLGQGPDAATETSRFFLGEDGKLYEVIG
jgi:hypothetical protein